MENRKDGIGTPEKCNRCYDPLILRNDEQVEKTHKRIDDLRNQVHLATELADFNAEQIVGLKTEVHLIRKDIEPIAEILTSINESVKILGWIRKFVLWVGGIAAAVAGILTLWTEHLGDYFKNG